MGMKYEAVLKRGKTYGVFGITFAVGVPGPRLIIEREREYLEETAIHISKTTEGERIAECMFEFHARPQASDDDYHDETAEEEDDDDAGQGDGTDGSEGKADDTSNGAAKEDGSGARPRSR